MKTFFEWQEEKLNHKTIHFCEGSLNRLIDKTKDPFAIITAYRRYRDDGKTLRTKAENIERNRELRGYLNEEKMGVHQLIGHWGECIDESITDYTECPENMKRDVIERSYFVPMPPNYNYENLPPIEGFKKKMLELAEKYNQDAIIFFDGKRVKVFGTSGDVYDDLGSEIALNTISRGYSQHILKQNVPFTFKGIPQPQGNTARMAETRSGLILPSINEPVRVLKDAILIS
jgi:putative transposon-encoded protein